MSKEIISALIQAGAALVGVGLGWLLAYWQGSRRDRKVERNVRALLRMEIDANLAALGSYQEAVKITIAEMKKSPHDHGVRAEALKATPLPKLDRQVFDALMPSLPNALNEEEMEAVLRFYTQLDDFKLLEATGRRGW
jgi:hypothetical protein